MPRFSASVTTISPSRPSRYSTVEGEGERVGRCGRTDADMATRFWARPAIRQFLHRTSPWMALPREGSSSAAWAWDAVELERPSPSRLGQGARTWLRPPWLHDSGPKPATTGTVGRR